MEMNMDSDIDVDSSTSSSSAEEIVVNNAEISSDGNNERKILEILKSIHHNTFDISEYTAKFPLHMIQLETNFNIIFGYTRDYMNLEVLKYQMVNGTQNFKQPYFCSFSMVIGPEEGFPHNNNLDYIPTDFLSTQINNKLPIIQGYFMLAGSDYPFRFMTNLVPLEDLKYNCNLIKDIQLPIRDMEGRLNHIDVVEAQEYIQATIRVALMKEIIILEKLYGTT
jgi:hypothetical protein